MEKEIKKLQNEIAKLNFRLKTLEDATYKTSKREIINKEVQFLQKCYRANGTLITTINT
jgi:hypothetical protein